MCVLLYSSADRKSNLGYLASPCSSETSSPFVGCPPESTILNHGFSFLLSFLKSIIPSHNSIFRCSISTLTHLLPINFKIQIPVVLTPGVKSLPTPRTPTPTLQILINTENVFASSTEHRSLLSRALRPHTGLVRLTRIVAADTCVELLAAKMLDGDYV